MVEQSNEIGKLAMALVAAQAEFHPVAKDADNPFFKSKYADLPAIVSAIQPVLAKHGLAVSQLPGCDDMGDLLATRLMHSSGEWIQSSMRLHLVTALVDKQTGERSITPQTHGSALTYARRYALSAILGIVTDEDDDGNAASQRRPARQTRERGPVPNDVPDLPPTDPNLISDAQRKRMFAIAKQAGVTNEHIKQILVSVTGDSSTSSVKRRDYDRIVELIEAGEVPDADQRIVDNLQSQLGSYGHPNAP